MASPLSPAAPTSPAPTTGRTARREPAGEARVERSLGRRPSLPGGRALVGAALVVAAGVMTYAAYVGAGAAPSQTYVVAARELPVNHRIGAGDLAVVTGDLPPESAGETFAAVGDLDGAVVLAPLHAHTLVLRSVVLPRDAGGAAAAPEAYEVSFTAPAWKLGGTRLRAGELIDIVPLGDKGDPSRAPASPVRNVPVVDRADSGGGGLGGASASGDVTVTVAAADPSAYLAIVGAVRGEFWVVRATRASGDRTVTPSAGTAAAPTWPPGTGVPIPTTARRP
jgi:hypothetical protein